MLYSTVSIFGLCTQQGPRSTTFGPPTAESQDVVLLRAPDDSQREAATSLLGEAVVSGP